MSGQQRTRKGGVYISSTLQRISNQTGPSNNLIGDHFTITGDQQLHRIVQITQKVKKKTHTSWLYSSECEPLHWLIKCQLSQVSIISHVSDVEPHIDKSHETRY